MCNLSTQERRPRRGRGRGVRQVTPLSDEEQQVDEDLRVGRFASAAVQRSSTSKRLLSFLAPEIKEINMGAKDQGYMVQAMTNEGFDLSLFDIVFPCHCIQTTHALSCSMFLTSTPRRTLLVTPLSLSVLGKRWPVSGGPEQWLGW